MRKRTADPRAETPAGTNPARAGEHNQRVVLQAIRMAGETTRLELAKLTRLTAPAITGITNRLLEKGYVTDAGRRTGVRGMPAFRFAINPDGCYGIGVNVDRDHLSVVSLDLAGKVRTRASCETRFASPQVVLDYVRKQIDAIVSSGTIDPERILGLGVALPGGLGSVDLLHRPPEYRVWDEIDIAAHFGMLGPWPVLVENDAAAAAMGEAQFGRGLVHRSFFYILISAGLGGGLVVAGKYFAGATGRAGRIGFLHDRDNQMLQNLVSISGLNAALERAGHTPPPPSALEASEPSVLETVGRWIEQSADTLCGPIGSINRLVDPGAILIGGRLPRPFIDRLALAVTARVAPDASPLVPVAPVLTAELAADAPAVGAAILPFNAFVLPVETIG